MSRLPRVQAVTTPAGVHGRIVGGNGEIVWTTEVYTSRAALDNAIELLEERKRLGQAPFTATVEDVEEEADPVDPDDLATFGGTPAED